MSLPQSKKKRKMKNEKKKEKLKKGKAKINFGDITKNHSLSIDKEACGRKLNCQMGGRKSRKGRWKRRKMCRGKAASLARTHVRK